MGTTHNTQHCSSSATTHPAPTMSPGASIDMVNASAARKRHANGMSDDSSSASTSTPLPKQLDPRMDFDVEIPGHVMQRRPVATDVEDEIYKPWLPRANLAVSRQCPFGTQTNNWAKQHKNYSTLQQHCLFFDPDNDGVIWPSDTWRGLWQLGYPLWIIFFATVIIHAGFSWFGSDNWLLPDPLFRLKIKNLHRTKHGSDTHTFDQEGRFHPALFENIFTKYDRENKGGLTFMDGMRMLHGNRVVADFAGYLAGFVEWVLTYFLVAKDGVVYKEDMRKVYDGSIFFERTGTLDKHT